MPAETDRHERTLIAWPTEVRRAFFGGHLEAARTAWADVARAVAGYEPVTMVVNPGERPSAEALMGEAVAAAHLERRALVIHANGSFHSDYRFGTAERAKWRAPSARIAVVSFVPVPDLDTVDARAQRKLGDYVVFTLATSKPAPAAASTP